MKHSVYAQFMRAIYADDCAAVMTHWQSPKLIDSDRQWGFKEVVEHNRYGIARHMLVNYHNAGELMVNQYGNRLKWLAEKKTSTELVEFHALTDLLISHTDRLDEQQQYEIFAMFVGFQHHTSVAQMAHVLGISKIHAWLQANPAWNEFLPDIMQNITLQHSVGEGSLLPHTSIRKM